MSLILVTGATGFLGRQIVRQCQAAGLKVRATGRALRAPDLHCDYHPANLCDPRTYPDLLVGARTVIHAAGLAHQFGRKANDRAAFVRINAEVTERLARTAALAGVEHFVLASSVSVYGPDHERLVSEDAACHPQGHYAESKWLAEQWLLREATRDGLRVTILRLATLYGQEDPGNVARLIQSIDRGRFVWIGAGTNSKTLIHRDDAARACVLAAQRNGRDAWRVYNVAAPAASLREIVTHIAGALGRNPPRFHVPAELVETTLACAAWSPIRPWAKRWQHTVEKWLRSETFDGSALARDVNFKPRIDLAAGLKGEVDWYRGVANEVARRMAA